ncbi:peptide chain release factor N(5)-glutamine methyltransferase [Pedobacter sp. N36a]|uniref:peptide chain release factor N(5)-glutamine methyltransferase n=1 Tax=Pedobacter sp. N36a TaxID=2767996 RepID=UPI0016574F11|nr:peptide chain release factor N(5)-glutamine methyltransferase [Pedobacter sp. N36a]MBC8985255.1 peptide chain release factor N(5)-glutamine methyltransferase [Pedobacter sp. N36a]
MNLSQLLAHFKTELKDVYEDEEVKSIFSVAVEHLLKITRSSLMMNWDKELSLAVQEQFYAVAAGLKTHKPIQYLLGEAYFYGSFFIVNEAVLIPRPETEELVDWILEDHLAGKTVIDFGTGSGCIAISLKKHVEALDVTAVDLSQEALSVASENALRLGSPVNFIHADILSFKSEARFDIIVSNPPYITGKEMAEMHQNVLAHEPHLALFVPDERPLLFYEAVADFAVSNLKKNGKLFFEINEYLSEETIQMLKDKGFEFISLRKDMQGKPRMILASKVVRS